LKENFKKKFHENTRRFRKFSFKYSLKNFKTLLPLHDNIQLTDEFNGSTGEPLTTHFLFDHGNEILSELWDTPSLRHKLTYFTRMTPDTFFNFPQDNRHMTPRRLGKRNWAHIHKLVYIKFLKKLKRYNLFISEFHNFSIYTSFSREKYKFKSLLELTKKKIH